MRTVNRNTTVTNLSENHRVLKDDLLRLELEQTFEEDAPSPATEVLARGQDHTNPAQVRVIRPQQGVGGHAD
jgi:hypothetical protein